MPFGAAARHIGTIIRVDALGSIQSFLGFACGILDVFNRLTGRSFGCGGDVLHAKARGKYGNFHLVAKALVEGNAPLEDEVGAELGHELVYIVNLFHHEVRTLVVLLAKRDVE